MIFYFFLLYLAEVHRVRRQEADEEELEKQLCADKGAGEWFRLETGEDKCRDVIQCTASVSLLVSGLTMARWEKNQESVAKRS